MMNRQETKYRIFINKCRILFTYHNRQKLILKAVQYAHISSANTGAGGINSFFAGNAHIRKEPYVLNTCAHAVIQIYELFLHNFMQKSVKSAEIVLLLTGVPNACTLARDDGVKLKIAQYS